MSKPSSQAIENIKVEIGNKKAKLERSFRKKIHSWHIKVYREFVKQYKFGMVNLTTDLKDELKVLLIDHYKKVAEAFIPGLDLAEIKQDTINANDKDSYIIPILMWELERSITRQIESAWNIHWSSIVESTNQVGNEAIVKARKQQANYQNILATSLVSREKTISITETNWIAEYSLYDIILKSSPFALIADKSDLKLLQKISPNVTLKDRDINKLFEEPRANIEKFRETIAFPEKMWLTMGDLKVRKTHAVIDIMVLPVNEPFKLQGGLVMFPGDSSLGVAFREIINCRCHIIYF